MLTTSDDSRCIGRSHRWAGQRLERQGVPSWRMRNRSIGQEDFIEMMASHALSGFFFIQPRRKDHGTRECAQSKIFRARATCDHVGQCSVPVVVLLASLIIHNCTMFYLSPEDWSPRFNSTFYTVQLTNFEIWHEMPPPPSSTTDENRTCEQNGRNDNKARTSTCRRRSIGGRSSHPAVYYGLEIRCGHRKRTIWRRYSQFRSLCRQAATSPPPPSTDPRECEAERKRGSLWSTFPPRQVASGPCFVIPCITSKDDWKDEEFIEKREEELGRFLRDLLTRRGYCSHPIVVEFLELDGFVGDELNFDVVS